MTTLHIINKSPQHPFPTSQCALFYSPEDSILLIEDAVYYALTESYQNFRDHFEVKNQQTKPTIYALKEDIEARGLANLTHQNVQLITYSGFVELTANHDKSSSWY